MTKERPILFSGAMVRSGQSLSEVVRVQNDDSVSWGATFSCSHSSDDIPMGLESGLECNREIFTAGIEMILQSFAADAEALVIPLQQQLEINAYPTTRAFVSTPPCSMYSRLHRLRISWKDGASPMRHRRARLRCRATMRPTPGAPPTTIRCWSTWR